MGRAMKSTDFLLKIIISFNIYNIGYSKYVIPNTNNAILIQ